MALEHFYNKLTHAFGLIIPTKRLCNVTRVYPVWFTSEIITNIKTKDYYRRKWMLSKKDIYWTEFRRLRTITKRQISAAHSNYLEQAQICIKSDVSHLWSYINHKRGRTRIPGTLYLDGGILDDPQSIVDSFAKLFSSTLATCNTTSTSPSFSYLPNIQPSFVTEKYLLDIMAQFPNKFTSGDDYIPSFIVKNCRASLAKPLTILINLCLTLNIFPDRWKRSKIVPVFKKDDVTQIKNYRPISILSNFAKIFEQVLYDCIYNSVRIYLSPIQHGFISGRSTITNLVTMTQYLSEHLDNRGQVDVIYTDLSRAFDTISHSILLAKLNTFGFSTSFILLMKSYFENRTAHVSYNGYKSFQYVVTSGVPQGSNLGPLLFLLYIDDLLKSLTCPALAYADDLKIYSSLTDKNNAKLLQENLNIVSKWCDNNGLKLNISKCFTVTYTRRTSPTFNVYKINDIPLKSLKTITDLGVLFDSELTFTPHIDAICTSAASALGFVIRTCREFTDISLMKMLYFTFVVSKLEYASVVWHPMYVTHSQNIERIQRRFLKYLSFRMTGNYPIRGANLEHLMTELSVVPLASRREQHSVTFLYKLINNKIDCPHLLSQISFNVPRIASRSTDTFFIPTARTNALVRAPITRMCRNANDFFPDILG